MGLLLLSRLPLLLASPDWGPFAMEHCFFLSVPYLVDALSAQFPGHAFSIGSVSPNLFSQDFHGGSWWVGALTHGASRLLGDHGLLSLKLVSLAHAAIALGLTLWALSMVWRSTPARVIFPVLVAFITPPTMMLWSSLLLMGHYYETWFFHGLALPVMVLLLRGVMPLWGLALAGAGCGLALAYAFSNLVYPALFALLCLLPATGPLWRRAAALTALGAGAAATALPFFLEPTRWASFAKRFARSGLGGEEAPSLLDKAEVWLSARHWHDALFVGDGWSREGLLGLWFQGQQPGQQRPGVALAYLAAALCLAGAVYLLRAAALLLWRRGREMGLGQRLAGAHGLLLLAALAASLLFEKPYPHTSFTSYKAILYPALLFGAGQVLAALWGLGQGRRWPGRAAALLLLAPFTVGWASSAAWNLRPVQRPDLDRCHNERALYLGNEHGLPDEEVPKSSWASRRCQRAFPDNPGFCRAMAWDIFVNAEDPEWCRRQSGPEAVACAASWGRNQLMPDTCSTYSARLLERVDVEARCAIFTGDMRRGCVTGAYQGARPGYPEPPWCMAALVTLCSQATAPGTARRRACLEQSAWLAKGIGLLPLPDGDPPDACAAWPVAWRGLCQRALTARPAGPGETSCEQVYRGRFSRALPASRGLAFEQCLRAEGEPLTAGLYPTCAIGLARITSGLKCRWDGGPWEQ